MFNLFSKSSNMSSGNSTLPIKVSPAGTATDVSSNQAHVAATYEDGLFNQICKFCSFVSIAMTLFDGNYHILLIKNEMRKPQDFSKIAIPSVATFGAISFLLGFLSYIGMGSKLLSPVTEN